MSRRLLAVCAGSAALAAAAAGVGASSATAAPTAEGGYFVTAQPAATPTPISSPAPPMTTLPAGYFAGVQADSSAQPIKKAVSNSSYCTAGFAVTKGGITYVLGDNHCREWTNKRGRGLGQFASPVNVVSDLNPAVQTIWAAKLTCTGGDPRCLRPTRDGVRQDLLAWQPDPGTVTPVAQVMTRRGLEPVLSTGKWTRGKYVCRMGAQTQAEQCGKIGFLNPKKGYVYIKDADGSVALAGDSGGPVYTYVKDAHGMVLGVKALGILEQSTRTRSYFYPMATIESALGVNLMTADPNAVSPPPPTPTPAPTDSESLAS